MLFRLVLKSLLRRKARAAMVFLSVTTAAALGSALLNVSMTITEQMAKELRSFGANIFLGPRAEPLEVEIGGLKYFSAEESAYLEEADLVKIKSIFWRHNIVALAPFLSRIVAVGEIKVLLVGTWFDKEVAVAGGKRLFSFASGLQKPVAPEERGWRTGVKTLAPWWRVEGQWLRDEERGALVGHALAQELGLAVGEAIRFSYEGKIVVLAVRGILKTGGPEEEQILVPIRLAQEIFALPGKVEKVQVSALVKPDDALALRADKIGPSRLLPKEYESWYCTPYLNSIIYQVEEAIPGAKGKAILRVSESEGAFLGKMKLTVIVAASATMAAALLGVMATMAAVILERRAEIGLMKALGAEDGRIRLVFLIEGGLAGFLGGAMGYLLGLGFTWILFARTFSLARTDSLLPVQWVTLCVTLILALAVGLFGSFLPLRHAVRLDPARTLKGN